MKTLFIFCLFSIVISANCGMSSFVSKENELYAMNQKCKMEKIDLSNYKKYEISKDDNLEQCFRKLILLSRCFYASERNLNNMLTFILKNSHLAYKKFPNSPAIASIYAWYCKNKGTIVKSLPIILPFIQESKTYPIIPRVIQRMLLNAYNIGHTEDGLMKYLGDGNGKVGRKKLKLLCSYWLAKIDPKYTNNLAKSILIARKSMTLKNTHEALGVWKKVLSYIDKDKK